MVKVHVWLQHGDNVGHTALTIGDAYVSFWPVGGASKKDIKIKRSHPGSFVAELAHDVENEGGRQPTTVELHGLDETKMLEFVTEMAATTPRYQLSKHNCCHVVANCLLVGTNRRPSFVPHAGAYATIGRLAFGVWTPDQVLKFVAELKKHEDSV